MGRDGEVEGRIQTRKRAPCFSSDLEVEECSCGRLSKPNAFSGVLLRFKVGRPSS